MADSPLIYTPGGAALEYCPAGALALNPFEGLCPFSCHKTEHGGYNCYANQMAHQYKRDWPMRVKENLLEVKTWVSAEPLTMAQREYVVQGGLHDFIAFGVDRSYPRADAEDLAHAIPCLM